MKQREKTHSEKAPAAWDLAGLGMDVVGEFATDGFTGFVLYLAIMVPIVLITAFLDW
jgi:hypothetical protein